MRIHLAAAFYMKAFYIIIFVASQKNSVLIAISATIMVKPSRILLTCILVINNAIFDLFIVDSFALKICCRTLRFA